MADPALSVDGERLRLSGPITFTTAAALFARARQLLPGLPPSGVLDLEGATRVDSAGVALLVEFMRLRAEAGADLRLESVPGDVLPLLELYGLQEWLETGNTPVSG